MGAAASGTRQVTLEDGTIVADEAFAKAVARMHCIFKSCDAEFSELSDAANTHGKQSEQYKAAAERLSFCQQRRTTQFHAIEAKCGPAQGGYGECVRERGADRAHECLPVLQSFLDCAEGAVK